MLQIGIISLVVGIALVVFAVKKVEKGLLKNFILAAGASLIGFTVFAILHNLVYALFIYLFGEDFWIRTGIEDEPFFFLLAIIVCPLGFLVGATGSVVLGIKRLAAKNVPKEPSSNP